MRCTNHFVLAYLALQLQMQQNSCFLYHSITYQTDLLSYHSISSLPTHTQGFSFTTHRLFSDSKAVFSVGGRVISHSPALPLAECTLVLMLFFVQQDTPIAPVSHHLTRLVAANSTIRYSILVPLLLNQPWRTVKGHGVKERNTHVKWSPCECGSSCSKPIHLVTKEVLFTRLTENIALIFSQTMKDSHLWFRIRNPISRIIRKANPISWKCT